jgi:hypothetical protein
MLDIRTQKFLHKSILELLTSESRGYLTPTLTKKTPPDLRVHSQRDSPLRKSVSTTMNLNEYEHENSVSIIPLPIGLPAPLVNATAPPQPIEILFFPQKDESQKSFYKLPLDNTIKQKLKLFLLALRHDHSISWPPLPAFLSNDRTSSPFKASPLRQMHAATFSSGTKETDPQNPIPNEKMSSPPRCPVSPLIGIVPSKHIQQHPLDSRQRRTSISFNTSSSSPLAKHKASSKGISNMVSSTIPELPESQLNSKLRSSTTIEKSKKPVIVQNSTTEKETQTTAIEKMKSFRKRKSLPFLFGPEIEKTSLIPAPNPERSKSPSIQSKSSPKRYRSPAILKSSPKKTTESPTSFSILNSSPPQHSRSPFNFRSRSPARTSHSPPHSPFPSPNLTKKEDLNSISSNTSSPTESPRFCESLDRPKFCSTPPRTRKSPIRHRPPLTLNLSRSLHPASTNSPPVLIRDGTAVPEPILPFSLMYQHTVNLSRVGLSFLSPTEIARQMTLIDSAMFNSMKYTECFRQRWLKRGKYFLSPHISEMVDRFNLVARWVATEMVCERTESIRVMKLGYFTLLCKELIALGNYHGAMQV